MRTKNEPDEVTALRFIRKSLTERGYPPSQREIAKACGWTSPSGANTLIRIMEAKGLVRVTPRIPRALQVTDAGDAMVAETETV